jgi:CBS domain-containing protein
MEQPSPAAQGSPVERPTTAADVMTPNPVSIRADATIGEAMALFTNRGVNAAAVVDEAGRPIGVVSRTDILIHEREKTNAPASSCAGAIPSGVLKQSQQSPALPAGTDATQVRDIMTPAVFAVPTDYPVAKVLEEMSRLKVHQLYVVDAEGILVGVIESQSVPLHC